MDMAAYGHGAARLRRRAACQWEHATSQSGTPVGQLVIAEALIRFRTISADVHAGAAAPPNAIDFACHWGHQSHPFTVTASSRVKLQPSDVICDDHER